MSMSESKQSTVSDAHLLRILDNVFHSLVLLTGQLMNSDGMGIICTSQGSIIKRHLLKIKVSLKGYSDSCLL